MHEFNPLQTNPTETSAASMAENLLKFNRMLVYLLEKHSGTITDHTLWSDHDIADHIGIKVSAVRNRYCKAPGFPSPVAIEGTKRYYAKEVLAWIRAQRQGAFR